MWHPSSWWLVACALTIATPALADDAYFPLLSDEDASASRSVGDTSTGFVVGARQIVETGSVAVMPATRARRLLFATSDALELIDHAATALHDATGRRLWLGNLGRAGGGDIVYSVSHNAGRDFDLALCYRDPQGRPLDPLKLERIGKRGRSASGRLFDAPRCWIAIKALLTHPTIQVQYVFVAGWLRQQLLDHARAAGEPGRLRDRAARVIRHPWGAAAHDDHFHVRIFCSERDLGSGCVDTGPVHAWTPRPAGAREARIRAARADLALDDCERRRAAVDRLMLLGATRELPAIARRLDDACAEVRWSAAAAIGLLAPRRYARLLGARLRVETEPLVRSELVAARSSLRLGAKVRERLRHGAAALARSLEASTRLRTAHALDDADGSAHVAPP